MAAHSSHHDLELAARSDVAVLVSAAESTLRHRCARWIHDGSDRAGGPFVAAGGPATANQRRGDTAADLRRLFEEARGGTLFIDEIDRLDREGQLELAALLHALPRAAEGRLHRQPRIIAGASRLLNDGNAPVFSDVLYYRLNIIHINYIGISTTSASRGRNDGSTIPGQASGEGTSILEFPRSTASVRPD